MCNVYEHVKDGRLFRRFRSESDGNEKKASIDGIRIKTSVVVEFRTSRCV